MLQEISFSDFLKQDKTLPLVDVRSPGEYKKGHIPGACNIPLFTDEERAIVGTAYVQESREKAISIGYEFVTPKLDWFLKEARKSERNGSIAVHCWRGGMRSKAFAEHLYSNGFDNVFVIIGGYKAFRRHALNAFKTEADICLIGGYTGSGKTYMLDALSQMNEQVVDLERMANHKGSAFGKIGDGSQPSIEQFENNLYWHWKELNYNKTIWIEDESHRIGLVNIPMNFFNNMRSCPVIFVDIPQEMRAQHLVEEYSETEKGMLADSIVRISKRLGGLNTQKALALLENNEYYEVALISLNYYDKYYIRGLKNREHRKIFPLDLEEVNPKKNAKLVKNFYESIRQSQYKTHTV